MADRIRVCLTGWLLLLAGWLPVILLLAAGSILPVEASPDRPHGLTGQTLAYFIDPAASLNPQAAMEAARYQPLTGTTLSLGYTTAVLWVRLTLTNPAGSAVDALLQVEPERLEQVSLFMPGSGGGYQTLHNGLRVAVDQRPVPHRSLAFPLRLEPARTTVCYLRIQTRNAMTFKPVVWQPAGFHKAMGLEDMIVMFGVGLMVSLSVYAILFLPLQNEWSAPWLGSASLFACLIELSLGGYGYAYLWPDNPEWALQAPLVLGAIGQIFINRFLKRYLDVDYQHQPLAAAWMDWVLVALMTGMVAHTLGYPMVSGLPLAIPLILISLLTHLVITLHAVLHSSRVALYLMAGQALGHFATFVHLAESAAWLPFGNLSGSSLSLIVYFVSVLFFFLGVVRRVTLIQKQKESAESLALELQRTLCEGLEIQVEERTQKMNEAREEAEQANRAKGVFMAKISHELRVPLHVILGYAALLRRDIHGPGIPDYLAHLEAAANQLLKLTGDILDYTRIERDLMVMCPEPVYLGRLLNRWQEEGALLAARRGNRFASVFSRSLPAVVDVDAGRLGQAVRVFLANAARYTERGSIQLEVAPVWLGADRIQLIISIRDTGIGIPADDRARIFKPFERGSNTTHHEGMGLGLTIARQIISAMSGEITVESTPGAGSCFRIVLELTVCPEDAVAFRLDPVRVAGYAGETRRILLLIPAASHRRVLEEWFSDLGFEVRSTGNLDEFRQRLGAERADLAVLDPRLPDTGLTDLLETLRAARPGGIPSIVLAATGVDQPGVGVTLLKPVRGDELLQATGTLLGIHWVETPDLPETLAADPLPESASPDLDSLRALAERRSVYEIDAWIRDVRRSGDYPGGAWLAGIETRLAVFDFEGVAEQAARAGTGDFRATP